MWEKNTSLESRSNDGSMEGEIDCVLVGLLVLSVERCVGHRRTFVLLRFLTINP